MIHEYRIEPLSNHHNRTDFSSGVEALDNYLKRQAGQDIRKRVAAVFVLTTDGRTVAGYYSLCSHTIRLTDLPNQFVWKLPRYPVVPATLLGRLAVSASFRSQGIGRLLLLDAFHRVLSTTQNIASAMVVVDAKDEMARNFYLHHQFTPLPDHPNRLFFAVADIERLFAGAE